MSDFDAIDSLLASVAPEAELPDAQARRELREQAGLSMAQVARALGVSPSTVGGWETGRRAPSGEVRTRYAYLLDGLTAKLAPSPSPSPSGGEPAADAPVLPGSPEAGGPPPSGPSWTDGDARNAARTEGGGDADDAEDVEVLGAPEPCVLCGNPAGQRVAGFPQHLDPADCSSVTPQPEDAAPPAPQPEPARPASRRPTRRAFQPSGEAVDLIGQAVQAALAQHQGDVEAATAALVKKAIPDAMALLDTTRKGGRYDVVAHPWMPDVLKKQSSRGADQVWEARPKWTRHELPPGEHEVTALDINGAYLSALKTHLPLGQLEHSAGGVGHDRRRAGIHLITPPHWDHEAVLPNPVGQRDEPGPLWVTEPTLRLLLRLSGPKYGLCEPPVIHESYTSGATEGLLEKFRIALKDARDTAIADGDEVTLEYVKAMYSKFVSTMGESNYNRELYRPDWMHLIRSQAFANLWMKALKAHEEGLSVVRAMGTDELHVIGDWRRVFAEGRGVTEVKVKDRYTAGTSTDQTPHPGEGE
ncbi:helix-turn-helix domain-containing protein [Streptomyces sp. SID8379]|uniref:helix-turn-helix domain-containing protein n=1 Tax=unclassified Streptomyces TaxID=2593676 RepID=UPI00037FC7FA|nr:MULTISPECIES: helix-turn-helix transcriptional regulator [unclassified Streptomyces]MYW62536.1 helix-turn-helix domain-containing protein [Streptomyces sp. SID8379]